MINRKRSSSAQAIASELFRPVEYHRPSTVTEAVLLVKRSGAIPMCGGTDVLVEQNPTVRELVDLSRLPLSYIRRMGNGILIGATTRISQIERSSMLNRPPFDIIRDAVKDFGTIQIRNMATIGGNVCNGIPSADTPPPLIALDTVVKVEGVNGSRKLPLEQMYRHVRKLSLKRGEILTELRIPMPPSRTAAAYVRLSRSEVDIALASAAVRISLDRRDRVTANRIVLGAVAPIPLRARKSEDYLLGRVLDQQTLTECSHLASEESRPIDDVRATAQYRREMITVLVERAIRRAVSKLRRTTR